MPRRYFPKQLKLALLSNTCILGAQVANINIQCFSPPAGFLSETSEWKGRRRNEGSRGNERPRSSFVRKSFFTTSGLLCWCCCVLIQASRHKKDRLPWSSSRHNEDPRQSNALYVSALLSFVLTGELTSSCMNQMFAPEVYFSVGTESLS